MEVGLGQETLTLSRISYPAVPFCNLNTAQASLCRARASQIFGTIGIIFWDRLGNLAAVLVIFGVALSSVLKSSIGTSSQADVPRIAGLS